MNARLADIQDAFQKRMLTGEDWLSPLLSGNTHIRVYDHAYRARLLEVLANDFPALHTLLGDEQFGQVINDFLDSHPSQHRSVRWLGAPLSRWLQETPPWNSIPEASDMARFEWALGLAFDAPDANVLDQANLAEIPAERWPGLEFSFHPALQVISLQNDVSAFQQAVAHDQDPESAPEPLGNGIKWAVWRNHEELNVMFRKLEADEAAMLEAARQGADFTTLCNVLAFDSGGDEAAMRAAGLIMTWLESGWISGVNGSGS